MCICTYFLFSVCCWNLKARFRHRRRPALDRLRRPPPARLAQRPASVDYQRRRVESRRHHRSSRRHNVNVTVWQWRLSRRLLRGRVLSQRKAGGAHTQRHRHRHAQSVWNWFLFLFCLLNLYAFVFMCVCGHRELRVYPAASLMSFQQVTFNFGASAFAHLPPESPETSVVVRGFNSAGGTLAPDQRFVLPKYTLLFVCVLKWSWIFVNVFFFFNKKNRRIKMEMLRQMSVGDESSCAVCVERAADVALVPCGHE